MAEPARQTNPYDDDSSGKPVTRPDLRALEGNGEGGNPPAENGDEGGSKYNPDGDSGDVGGNESKAEGSSSLRKREKSPNSGGLYNPDGDQGRMGKAKSGMQGMTDRLSKLGKNKWFVGFGAAAAGGLVIIIILLVLLAGALKIPNLAEHITAYQMNRVARQFAKSVERTTAQKLVIESTSDSAYSKIKGKYGGLRTNTWGKFDNYRPNKVLGNLQTKNNLELPTRRTSVLGRKQITGITLDNKTYTFKRVTGTSRFIPGLRSSLELKNQVEFSRNFFPVLDESMKANNVGKLMRGITANRLRKQAGISLVAWAARGTKYGGETSEKARLRLEREANSKIQAKEIRTAVTPNVKENIEKVAEQEKKDIADDKKLKAIIANGGVNPDTSESLNKAFGQSTMKTLTSIVNPLAGVAMPMCIIYDGSLERNGPTIDDQTTSQQKSYYYLNSAASQQKRGLTTPEAVGALNNKAGDNISSSNPEIRANGGRVNTNNTISTQASPAGQVTILDALLPSEIASPINNFSDNICPVVLSTEFTIAAILVQLAAIFATGGTSEGATVAAGRSAETALGGFAENMFARFIGTKSGSAAGKVGDILTDTVKTGAKIAGATIAAKLIVMSHSNSLHNGLEQNNDFVNDADAGGNYTGNQLGQHMNYARPLTTPETSKSDEESRTVLVQQNKAKSAFERYASINNADSLISRVALMSSAYLKPSIVGTMSNLASNIFKPFQSAGQILANMNLQPALADNNSDTSNYGNVQFGWTKDEEDLIDSDGSYQLLDNQLILDQSGKQDAIQAKYGPCFEDSIGKLLTERDGDNNRYIVRDKNGNLLDEGVCAPSKLSYNNTSDSLAQNDSADSPKNHDLVFRWRLAKRYDVTVDQLTADQTKGDNPDGAAAPTPDITAADISGDAQSIAKKILSQKNKGHIVFNVLDNSDKSDGSTPEANIRQTANGKPAKTTSNCSGRGAQAPDNSVALNEDLLKFILELSLETNIEVNALAGQCHGSSTSNHYKGVAVDFDCPFNQEAADRIGKKYNISDGTGEYCSNTEHYHYSVGGR